MHRLEFQFLKRVTYELVKTFLVVLVLFITQCHHILDTIYRRFPFIINQSHISYSSDFATIKVYVWL